MRKPAGVITEAEPSSTGIAPALFVAHAQADAAWVHGFLLPELGLPARDVLTHATLPPGAPAAVEIERAVQHARRVLLVLSPAFLSDEWSSYSEVLAGHQAAARASDTLIPLLLEPCRVPLRLDVRVRLDCTSPDSWHAEVARLRALLNRPEPQPDATACPYPGMVRFDVGDERLFFGRGREVADLVRRLRTHPFLLVMGPSGCGKSSLVLAGVVPQMNRVAAAPYLLHVLRPGRQPMLALAATLGVDGPLDAHGVAAAAATVLGARPHAAGLLLVIDQLEEVFTQAAPAERAEFLAAVLALKQAPGCRQVLTLRADFYAALMESELWPLTSGERVEVATLRGDRLREAIVRPAAEVGVYLSPVLVERLVRDCAGAPGVLPLLQETLVALWENRFRRLLTVDAYERLGGEHASGLYAAMAAHADAALAALSPPERAVARRVFVHLVQFGEGREDTRRQQRVEDLRVEHEDPRVLDRVLHHLAHRRLVTVGAGDGGGRTVDLAHESLIAYWPELRGWLAEDRHDEEIRRRIEEDARVWRSLDHDAGAIHRGKRLEEELAWRTHHPAELSGEAERFLRASTRRRRLVHAGVAASAVLAVTVPVWAASGMLRENAWRNEAQNLGRAVLLGGGTVTSPFGGAPVRVLDLVMDAHEVSNEQYRLCVRAGGCVEVPQDGPSGADARLPVVNVTAYQAATYCRWVGGRLPTVEEWLYAARGPEGRRYPWGDDPPSPSRANAGGGTDEEYVGGSRESTGEPPSQPRLAAVDDPDFAAGRTPEGIWHLMGNAREWTGTGMAGPAGPLEQPWDQRGPVGMVALIGGPYNEAPGDEMLEPMAALARETLEINGLRCVADPD